MNETLETFTERLRKEADVETLRIDGSGRVRIPLPRKAILNPHFIVGGKDVPGRGRVTPGRDLLEDYLLVRPKLGDGPGFSFEEIRHLLSLRTRVKHDPELRAAIHTFLGWSRPMSVNNSVKIIELGIPLVFACAGGGSRFLTDLHALPGSSRVVLQGHDLYSPPALESYVGFPVVQAVNLNTAFYMAQRAYEEALRYAPTSLWEQAVGVACTAAMATNRERKGGDHAWIVVFSNIRVLTHHHIFETRSREEQEKELSELLAGILAGMPHPVLLPGMGVMPAMPPALSMVLRGEQDCLSAFRPQVGPWKLNHVNDLKAVLCGSFNPLHGAHLYMAQIAEQLLDGPVGFEISIANVDKGQIVPSEVMRRVEQFRGKPVVLTHAPTFREKCRVFKNVHFIIGADTLTRILDPKYGPVEETMEAMRESGNKFLVFSRPGREIPQEALTKWGDLFRMAWWGEADLSSSSIRDRSMTFVRVLISNPEKPENFWVHKGFVPAELARKGENPRDTAARLLEQLGLPSTLRPTLVHTNMGDGSLSYTFQVETTADLGDSGMTLRPISHLDRQCEKDLWGWCFCFLVVARSM